MIWFIPKLHIFYTENDSWTSCVQFWNKYIRRWGLFCNKKYHFTKMMYHSYIDRIGSKMSYEHLVNSVQNTFHSLLYLFLGYSSNKTNHTVSSQLYTISLNYSLLMPTYYFSINTSKDYIVYSIITHIFTKKDF